LKDDKIDDDKKSKIVSNFITCFKIFKNTKLLHFPHPILIDIQNSFNDMKKKEEEDKKYIYQDAFILSFIMCIKLG